MRRHTPILVLSIASLALAACFTPTAPSIPGPSIPDTAIPPTAALAEVNPVLASVVTTLSGSSDPTWATPASEANDIVAELNLITAAALTGWTIETDYEYTATQGADEVATITWSFDDRESDALPDIWTYDIDYDHAGTTFSATLEVRYDDDADPVWFFSAEMGDGRELYGDREPGGSSTSVALTELGETDYSLEMSWGPSAEPGLDVLVQINEYSAPGVFSRTISIDHSTDGNSGSVNDTDGGSDTWGA